MPDLTGDEMVLNNENNLQEENKVTLIYFWSMSCKQCEDSFPNLLEMAQRFSNKVTVLSIHMPRIAEDHNVQAIEQQLKRLCSETLESFSIIVSSMVLLLAFSSETCR